MMIFRLICISIILISTSCYSQSNFRYSPGLILGYDVLLPSDYEDEIEYFSSTYYSGGATTFGISNKLNFKKWCVQLDGLFGLLFQKQEFVFSNSLDKIINQTVNHFVPHWLINLSVGRDFYFKNENHFLNVQLGVSNVFHFGNNSNLTNAGSFSSTYTTTDNYWNEEMNSTEYEYSIGYEKKTVLLSPFLKLGLSAPFFKNRIEYGFNVVYKRYVYENFIYLRGDNFSAIANSRSSSASLGIYFNYFFGNNNRQD